jgi:hypothetical protein
MAIDRRHNDIKCFSSSGEAYFELVISLTELDYVSKEALQVFSYYHRFVTWKKSMTEQLYEHPVRPATDLDICEPPTIKSIQAQGIFVGQDAVVQSRHGHAIATSLEVQNQWPGKDNWQFYFIAHLQVWATAVRSALSER